MKTALIALKFGMRQALRNISDVSGPQLYSFKSPDTIARMQFVREWVRNSSPTGGILMGLRMQRALR